MPLPVPSPGAAADPRQTPLASDGCPTSPASAAAPQLPDHELLRPIAQGSYGEVWLARSALGTFRAVKIVYRKTFWHDHPFDREFKGIQKFEPISRSHEGLVDILQVGRGDGYFYYVMELADDASRPDTGCRIPDTGCQMPDAGLPKRKADDPGLSSIQYPVSSIQYPVSSIQHSVSLQPLTLPAPSIPTSSPAVGCRLRSASNSACH